MGFHISPLRFLSNCNPKRLFTWLGENAGWFLEKTCTGALASYNRDKLIKDIARPTFISLLLHLSVRTF